MVKRLRRLGFLCAVGAVLLGGCNSGANSTPVTTDSTDIRFLNGSPDLGNVDFYITSFSSTVQASDLAYGTDNAYLLIPSKAQTIVVTPTGVPATHTLTCTTPVLAANTRYTLVIAGKVAGGATATGLQCQLFAETVYSLPATQFQLGFHHASPAANAAGQTTVSFGLYSPGLTNYQLPSGTATFVSTLTSGVAVGSATNVLLPGVQTAPGLGVYVTAQTGSPPTTVEATTSPSQATIGLSGYIGSGNTNNFMPLMITSGTTTTTASSNLSVYAIDGQGGNVVQLVCMMD